MTIGYISYGQSPKFVMPRSYIRGICVLVDEPVDFVVNGAYFFDHTNPAVSFTIVVEPRWYAWSSNTYTLDFIITESYYKISPSPTQIPMPLNVGYWQPPGGGWPVILVIPFGLGFTQQNYHDYPPAPPTYWRQRLG